MARVTLAQAVERLQTRLAQLEPKTLGMRCLQLSESCDVLPLMAWLANQHCLPKLYWRGRRQGEEVVGLGSALDIHLDSMPSNEALDRIFVRYQRACSDANMRLYGGVAFDSSQTPWNDFGQARFVLPRIEIRHKGEQATVILNLSCQERCWAEDIDAAFSLLHSLRPTEPLPPLGPAHVLSRQDVPDRPRWNELVSQVVDPAFIQDTPKVVLARQSQFSTSALPSPWTVLNAWQLLNPGSYQYGFQFSEDQCFISCSPERLFYRLGRELSTEALAGTTVRGFTEEEDQALADALLADNKNSHENHLVREHIEEQLGPLCHYVGAEESPTVLKLNHIQHLHRSIHAELKAGVNDLQLLGALHPTPAVGGLPREAAMSFIRQREGYSRGWYAGACGYFGNEESEFSVAIRSARFEADKVTLYAGAGIVADSEPEAEWLELNNKLTTVLGILNGL